MRLMRRMISLPFRRTSWASAALVAVAILVVSCRDETPCTLVACSDGFQLTVRHSSARFPAGEWVVRVTPSGGAAQECSFVVSDDPGACGGHCLSSTTCDDLPFIGLPGEDRVLLSYPILTMPVLVEIERDSVAAMSEVVNAEYKVFRPNGPECPGECLVATAELVTSWTPSN